MIFFIFVHLRMSIFSTSSLHIGKMEFIFKVLRRNYCDMARYINASYRNRNLNNDIPSAVTFF